MFTNSSLVYLQLQKTACTHIERLLHTHVGGETVGKHNQLKTLDPTKLIMSSVRNPWDWYVSLWAYGCSAQGGVRNNATALKHKGFLRLVRAMRTDSLLRADCFAHLSAEVSRDRGFWQDCYADPTDAVAFRRWLHAIHGAPNAFLSEGGYGALPLSDSLGYMTFRIMRMAVLRSDWDAGVRDLVTQKDALDFWKDHNIVTDYVRVETLEQDLTAILQSLGQEVQTEDLHQTKTNTSKHADFSSYYDAETVALVAKRDHLMIDRFGYKAPLIK